MHYIKEVPGGVYEIGHYNPKGVWVAFMTWHKREVVMAVETVRKLNGGS